MFSYNNQDKTDYLARYQQFVKESNDCNELGKEASMREAKTELPQICPRCGRPLIMRVAKKGDHAGEKFWGCSGFPHCRYIEKI